MDNIPMFGDLLMSRLQESSKAFMKMGSAVSDCLNKMSMDMESIHVDVQDELERFHNACQYISLESIDGDVWKESRQAMEQWGYYGWTIHPYACLSELYVMPESQEFADEYMVRYCTDGCVEKLISEIRDTERCIINVFTESVNCYVNGYYTACASLLFELIDGVISDYHCSLSSRKSRLWGNAAIEKLQEMQDDETEMVKTINMYANTLACLKTMFKSKNMNSVSRIINRNQLFHGVWNKEVTKTDCIRIFMLYWHVLWMIKDLSMYN